MRRFELEIVCDQAKQKFNLNGETDTVFNRKCRSTDEVEIFSEDPPLKYWCRQDFGPKMRFTEKWMNRKWEKPIEGMRLEPWKWLTPRAFKNVVFEDIFDGIVTDEKERAELIKRAIEYAKTSLRSFRQVDAQLLVMRLVGDMWNGVKLWDTPEELDAHKKEAFDLYHEVFEYLCLPCEEPGWPSPFWGWQPKDEPVQLIDPMNVDDYYNLD